jgi:hypothetical protein
MAELCFSFLPYPNEPPHEQFLNLGNIADDIWREKLILVRGAIVDGRHIAFMRILAGRKLRKKERDELALRLKALRKARPELDAIVIYPDDPSTA